VIAINGGFYDLPAAKVSKLEFWKITGGQTDGKIHSIGSNKSNSVRTEEILLKAQKGLIELITAFDNPETPYESRPRVDYAPKYSDYEHLARIKEWSIISLDSED
jgi:ATP-dependent helicase/nuclease subunit B